MGAVYTAFFPDGQRQYIIAGIFAFLSLLYVLFGISSTYRLVKVIFKCAPLLFLISFLASGSAGLNLGPAQPKGNFEDLERIVFGLIFSLLGDFYLIFDSMFILGILAFASSHIVYINIFGGLKVFSYDMEYGDLLSAIAVGLISLTVLLYIWKKLSWLLVVPSIIYCIILSAMMWCALVNARHQESTSSIMGAAGAGLFYTSDLLLVLGRWRLNIPYGKYMIILTYYAAQILITFHVLKRF